MEAKKNLNNIQRKILDEIYTEQFDKREKFILDNREQELGKLQEKNLKVFAADKEIKKMVGAGELYFEMVRKLREKMESKNVTIGETLSTCPKLGVKTYFYGRSEDKDFPEVARHKKETRAIALTLGEKRKEMRAKIYGVSASYEEVDAEIKEILKDVK